MNIFFNNKVLFRVNILKILFYFFPLFLFASSGYLNAYIFIIITYSIYFFFINKIKIDLFKLDYLVFLFFFSCVLSTLLNQDYINNFNIGGKKINFEISSSIKSILNLRFAILFIIIRNIINKNLINIKFFSIISLFCTLFLTLNIFLQHLISHDLFGNYPFDGRYNGIFEHEAIAGSYLQKLLLISIISIFLLKITPRKKFLLIFTLINILALGILLSFDRMPYLIFLLSIIILIFILKTFRIKLLFLFLSMIFVFIIFLNNYYLLKDRYISGLSRQFELSIFKELFNKDDIKIISSDTGVTSLKSDYIKNYITALKIIVKKPLLGSGLKSFSLECEKLKENYENELACMTHPHNLYLEILINQGALGILIFSALIIFLIKENILFFNSNKINAKIKLINIFFFTILIVELIPFRSYGSIFTTFNGTIFWFVLAFVSTKPKIINNYNP